MNQIKIKKTVQSEGCFFCALSGTHKIVRGYDPKKVQLCFKCLGELKDEFREDIMDEEGIN